MQPGFAASEIDTSKPHPARMYNAYLGGNDNYPVDREAVREVARLYPEVRSIALANRAFLQRAVRFLAGEAGIRQFLDIGTGIPSAGNVHEVAGRAAPGARVVYVDNDHLPITEVDLEGMPDDVSRRLFEALRLEIRYDPAVRTARCSITLAGDTIDAVSRTAQEATARGSSRCATRPAGMVPATGDGLYSAPSGATRKPSSVQPAGNSAGRLVITGSYSVDSVVGGIVL